MCMVATQVLFPDILTGILENEQLWLTKPSPDISLISTPGLYCLELKTKPVEETGGIINIQNKSNEKDKLHPV